MSQEWNPRAIYYYLVSFVSLMMLVFGTVNLINVVFDLAIPPSLGYKTLALEEAVRPRAVPGDPEYLKKTTSFENERMRQELLHRQWRLLAQVLALLLVAAPIYRYHWRRAQHELGP